MTTMPVRPAQTDKVLKMEDYKANPKPTKPKAATVSVKAMAMALEQQKQKYEARIAALEEQLAAKPSASAVQVPRQKSKRTGEPYNNVPGSTRSRRFRRQVDKVLSGVQSGKLRGKMHGEYEVIGQSTIRSYLKLQALPCGSETAASLQDQLVKAGLCEDRDGNVVLKQQLLDLDSAA